MLLKKEKKEKQIILSFRSNKTKGPKQDSHKSAKVTYVLGKRTLVLLIITMEGEGSYNNFQNNVYLCHEYFVCLHDTSTSRETQIVFVKSVMLNMIILNR